MKKSKLTASFKEMRDGQTQEQLAMELNVSRETVSSYENGRSRIPADIAQKMMNKQANPRFAIAIRHEYTQTGPVWLNGPNVDLHRSSVKEKAIEEFTEALEGLMKFSFAKPLKTLDNWQRPELVKVLDELTGAITAGETLLAVVCEEGGISYSEVWERHYQMLRTKGYYA